MQAPLKSKSDTDAVQTETRGTPTQERSLVDQWPVAVAQRGLAEAMNNSPRVLQQRALSDAIHDSPRMVAQRHEMDALFGKPRRSGLPGQLKAGIESLSGISMDHVKVNYNSAKPAQLQAHAYAQGSEIHVGPRQERHLPHEAWHIVQQAQGRVRPTLQMKTGVVNDDPSLEREADVMGEKAAQFKGVYGARSPMPEERAAGVVTQRFGAFGQRSLPAKLRSSSLAPAQLVRMLWSFRGIKAIPESKKNKKSKDHVQEYELQPGEQFIDVEDPSLLPRLSGATPAAAAATSAAAPSPASVASSLSEPTVNSVLKTISGVKKNDEEPIRRAAALYMSATEQRYSGIEISYSETMIIIKSAMGLFHFSFDIGDNRKSHFTFESLNAHYWLHDNNKAKEILEGGTQNPLFASDVKNAYLSKLVKSFANSPHDAHIAPDDADKIVANVLKGIAGNSKEYGKLAGRDTQDWKEQGATGTSELKGNTDAHYRAAGLDDEAVPKPETSKNKAASAASAAISSVSTGDISAVWAEMKRNLCEKFAGSDAPQKSTIEKIIAQTETVLELGRNMYNESNSIILENKKLDFSDFTNARTNVSDGKTLGTNAVNLVKDSKAVVPH